jgi:transcription initiation factor IIF auxiliary subunit
VSNNPGGISQSNSGSMAGGMQAAIGNYNKQGMNAETSSDSNTPTQAEVVELLAQIERIIQDAELPEVATSKATKYIEAAKIEAEESEPDKQLISKNLERVTKNLEEVDKTVDTSKRIFEKVVPLVMRISSWLGMAIGSL